MLTHKKYSLPKISPLIAICVTVCRTAKQLAAKLSNDGTEAPAKYNIFFNADFL